MNAERITDDTSTLFKCADWLSLRLQCTRWIWEHFSYSSSCIPSRGRGFVWYFDGSQHLHVRVNCENRNSSAKRVVCWRGSEFSALLDYYTVALSRFRLIRGLLRNPPNRNLSRHISSRMPPRCAQRPKRHRENQKQAGLRPKPGSLNKGFELRLTSSRFQPPKEVQFKSAPNRNQSSREIKPSFVIWRFESDARKTILRSRKLRIRKP